MKISIIIPIYQFTPELAQLSRDMLTSLGETKGLDDAEIIVIDNGSSVDADYLKNGTTIYLRNRENLGFCKAVNQGFKLASGDLIVVANSDILVSSNWREVVEEIFNENPKVGTVHFRMQNYEEEFFLGFETWPKGKEKWCHGSFYVIKRKVLDEVGYYDEAFGLGGYDDYDLWMRIRKAGYSTAYTNRSAFKHKHSSTALALDIRDKDRQERDYRNREYFKKKWNEYPDILFEQTYPEQSKESWFPFP